MKIYLDLHIHLLCRLCDENGVTNVFIQDCQRSRGESLPPLSHQRAAMSGAAPIDQALDGLPNVTERTIRCKFNIAELTQDTFRAFSPAVSTVLRQAVASE